MEIDEVEEPRDLEIAAALEAEIIVRTSQWVEETSPTTGVEAEAASTVHHRRTSPTTHRLSTVEEATMGEATATAINQEAQATIGGETEPLLVGFKMVYGNIFFNLIQRNFTYLLPELFYLTSSWILF